MNSKNIPKKIKDIAQNLNSVEDMTFLLQSPYSYSEKEIMRKQKITCYNKMDLGEYSYILDSPYGKVNKEGYFEPKFTPKQMLELGVFEGKYLNDCVLEFPREWFLDALKNNKLSPEEPNVDCNFFGIKSRQSLQVWEEKDWIYSSDKNIDNRGWFQWYCRYFMGRRDKYLDELQIKRWRSFKRHYGQVEKNCEPGNLECRPKQRQALLQWSYDCFI
jgi:hypothetical protein